MTLRLCLNSLGIFALARNRERSSPTCLAHKTWRSRALTNWELFPCANAVLWTSPRYSYIMVWISMSIFGFASPPTVNHNFLLLSANPNHSLLLTSAPLAPLEWVPSAISTATLTPHRALWLQHLRKRFRPLLTLCGLGAPFGPWLV